MMHAVITGIVLLIVVTLAISNGPDYESLPLDTIFPGPWESNIRAPVNKSHIAPVKIFNSEGAVSGAEAVLQGADVNAEASWIIGPGGLTTFEFGENIAGKVCFQVDNVRSHPSLSLSYSESPFFAGREPDATGDRQARDLPLQFLIKKIGLNCVKGGYNRGAFKYLTVFMPESDVSANGGFWHDDHSVAPRKPNHNPSFYDRISQKFLGRASAAVNRIQEPAVTISAVFVNCTAFPSNPNGRAYTGYFDSSSSILNRVWYAGAWTLQLSTIDPQEGGSVIDFNRNFDHNNAPQGAWYSNYTVSNGTVVTTDGAKRDRMVWPGDMTIAVPGIAVSTYDMLAVRNALDTIYEHQYPDGSMPYAGPPMGALGEFSDTYHLHTLVGTYAYVLYSGDLEWLRARWQAYIRALEVSIKKVDKYNLLHVSSVFDWIRPGMTGHNVEASAILYDVLGKSITLATWLDEEPNSNLQKWSELRSRLERGIATLYCKYEGLYSDNMGRRGCQGPEKVLPQDGNSWVLLSQASVSPLIAFNVSENLRARWIKYGAPAVEFPNVISPFASSFELLGHISARNPDAAVELIELMWGYMLDGPGMTNSTLLEGYRVDGYIQYPAYWSDARNSHAHGWAAGPTTVLMQGILGITLTSPLGKTWTIEPQLSKWLSYARGGFATKLGKFEVAISLMRSPSTGHKVEVLEVTVPEGTSGTIKWGGKEQILTAEVEGGSSFKFFRYIDGSEVDQNDVYTLQELEADFVKDDTWVKPEIDERMEGVVDWEALEANYGLAEQRFGMSRAYALAVKDVENEAIIPTIVNAKTPPKEGSESQRGLQRLIAGMARESRQIIRGLGNWLTHTYSRLSPQPLQAIVEAAEENELENHKMSAEPENKHKQLEINKQALDLANADWARRVILAEEKMMTGAETINVLQQANHDWAERVKLAEGKAKADSDNRQTLSKANQDWAERVKAAEEKARLNSEKFQEDLK